jgi:hypothetical protein
MNPIKRSAKSKGRKPVHVPNSKAAEPAPESTALKPVNAKDAPAQPSPARKPQPVSFQPLPLDATPGVLRTMAEEGADSIGSDPSYFVTMGLALSAGVVNCARFAQIIKGDPGFREPCVLWGLNVGPSGSKKSPAWRTMNHPLLMLSETLRERARINCTPPRELFVTDANMAGIQDALAQNKGRGMIYSRDEGTALFASMTRFDQDEAGEYLELYYAGTIIRIRKLEPKRTEIKGACLSIACTITPGMLRRALYKGGHFENGMLFRFLVTCPPRKPSPLRADKQISPTASMNWKNLIYKFANLHGDHVTLCPTPEAMKIFEDYYNACDLRSLYEEEAVASAISKSPGQAARLALLDRLYELPECEDGRGEITPANMFRGCKLAAWYLREMERMLPSKHQTDQERYLQTLADQIALRPNGQMSARELQRSNGKRYPTKELAILTFQELVDEGLCELVDKDKWIVRTIKPEVPSADITEDVEEADGEERQRDKETRRQEEAADHAAASVDGSGAGQPGKEAAVEGACPAPDARQGDKETRRQGEKATPVAGMPVLHTPDEEAFYEIGGEGVPEIPTLEEQDAATLKAWLPTQRGSMRVNPLLAPDLLEQTLNQRQNTPIDNLPASPTLIENLKRQGIETIGHLAFALERGDAIGLGAEQERIRGDVEAFLSPPPEQPTKRRKKVGA